jgi:hypothetical protein
MELKLWRCKMRKKSLISITILFMLLFGSSLVQADDIDNKLVQEAMENYIKGKLSSQGGLYEIKEVKAEFDYLHSGVKEDGSLFVSCADFKAGNDVYDIDYYVKSTDGKYIVVKEIFHKKNEKPVNDVLWQLN